MANNPFFSDEVCIASLNAATAKMNSGSVAIYTGSQPGDANLAASGTLLVKMTLSSSAFGQAVGSGVDGLSPPAAPVPTTASSGGTVANGTYTVAVSYVNANGETVGSLTGSVVTTGTNVSTITVPSPASVTGATGWYAYVSQAGGTTLTRQQTAGSPTAIGTNLTLTAPPTNTGLQPQGTNTTSSRVATASANPIASGTAVATGTAGYFVIYKSDGVTVAAMGSVGTSGCDMNLTPTSIVLGNQVTLSSGTLTQPE